MKNFDLEKRRYVLSAIASLIIVVYIIRLFSLQIASDDYRKSADSNAFLKKIEFPSRGTITDRNGKLLVYNQPAYDIMVVMNEEAGRLRSPPNVALKTRESPLARGFQASVGDRRK